MIKKLKPLVMMQLKDKIDFSFMKNKKKLITKIILSILSFALITGIIFALLFVSKLLKLFHLVDIVPVSVIVVVFTIMEIFLPGSLWMTGPSILSSLLTIVQI